MYQHAWEMFHESDDARRQRAHKDFHEDDGCATSPSAAHIQKVLKVGVKASHRAQQAQFFDHFEPSEPVRAKKYMYNVQEGQWETERLVVSLDSKPFAHGALRECFRLVEVDVDEVAAHRDKTYTRASTKALEGTANEILEGMQQMTLSERSENKSDTSAPSSSASTRASLTDASHWQMKETDRKAWVAKRSMKDWPDHRKHKDDCLADAALQQVAKHYGELFSKAARDARHNGCAPAQVLHDVDFLMAHVIELQDGRAFGVEAFVFGEYEKFNNNSGMVFNPKCHITPQAFSYYTFVESGYKLMVVDIQGVGDIFTDPVMHFLPQHNEPLEALGDQGVNMGIRGFALFLWSHRHSRGDLALGLPSFPHALAEQRSVGGVAGLSAMELAATAQRRVAMTQLQPPPQPSSGDEVIIERIPGVDLRPSTWSKVRLPEEYGLRGRPVLPLSLVVAACHMEIAVMYHDGRLCDEPQKGTSAPEAEAAVFHLALAAQEGLPEAMLALARVVSGMSHEDYLPAVSPKEVHEELCVLLLRKVAEAGARCKDSALAACGSLAQLYECGSLGTECAKSAAEYYQLFAQIQREAGEADGDASEVSLGLHVSSCHGRTFGWENHGVQAHRALAKAADYHFNLSGAENMRKAAELYTAAAELAYEDPMLAKAAMRYEARAEECASYEEGGEEEGQEEKVEEDGGRDGSALRQHADDAAPKVCLTVEGVPKAAVDAFLVFAERFGSQAEAFVALVGDVPAGGSDAVGDAPAKMKDAGECDEDIWAMLG